LIFFTAAVPARCATQSWNPGGAGGGNGTWNPGIGAVWDSGQVWTNGNTALFGGTGGDVTVINPSAAGLTFSASGAYLLQSGTLTLTGSSILMDSAATIAGSLVSTVGLAVTGTSVLTLTGAASLGSNTLTINQATVDIDNGCILTGSAGVIDAGGVANVSGTAAEWMSTTSLCIGNNGAGTLQITSGAQV
jgi:T5SS/PEP-CTERM-associated repeat protein